MAVAVACGARWAGRDTSGGTMVVYLGAEGGNSLHFRRVAAEQEHGRRAPYLFVVQERPQLDAPEGRAALGAILGGLTDAEVYPERSDTYNLSRVLRDGEKMAPTALLVIIDTYSQTSSGDDKTNVSAYIKTLRDLIDGSLIPLSFLVIDHATKSGDSYAGSVAKLNDVDSQIEVARDGRSNRITLYHRKSKNSSESAPIALEAVPTAIAGYADAYGNPLSALVIRDGTKAAALAEIADGKAGLLVEIARELCPTDDGTLRAAFYLHDDNAGAKQESVNKAYRRAKERLFEIKVLSEEGGILACSLA